VVERREDRYMRIEAISGNTDFWDIQDSLPKEVDTYVIVRVEEVVGGWGNPIEFEEGDYLLLSKGLEDRT
jgi:hypothetical protein